jgi:glycosyltransferase involved in cell wall biosynthesis
MLRILSICYEYPPLGGGGAKVVAGLLGALNPLEVHVDLVTMWYPGLPWKESRPGFNIYRIPCIRTRKSVCLVWEMPLYLVFALPVLLGLVLKYRYELNHTHFIFPDGVLAFLLKAFTGLPYVITAHGSDVPGYNPHRFTRMHHYLRPFWKQVVRYAKAIVCPSESVEKLIDGELPEARTTIIPNGLDLDKFVPDREKTSRLLVVTRMFERKGVQYLLNALEHMDHDYEVHIVGDGPYLSVLRGQVDDKNLDVSFWGFLDNQSTEIRDLYETSRIFIFPSEAENFPIVLLEAMAAGMAIITTYGTGCAEVVGDAAVLVKPKDAHDIREALKMLIENPEHASRLGQRARARLEGHFSWQNVAAQDLARYRQSID